MNNKDNILFQAEIRKGNSSITYKIRNLQMIQEYSIENKTDKDSTINIIKICRGPKKHLELKEELKQVPSPILVEEENTNDYAKIKLFDEDIEFLSNNLNDQVVKDLFKVINRYFNYFIFFENHLLDIKEDKVEKMPPLTYETENLFTAHEGGYFGSTYNFFIAKQKDRLRFEKQIYKRERINNKEYIIEERKIRLYPMEMLELLEKNVVAATSNWNKEYKDLSVLDGTTWEIEFINKFKFEGINAFPENYKETFKLINKYFN